MKKALKTVVLLSFAILFCLALSSCDSPAEHTHTFGDWMTTKEATCASAGEETRTCSECGKTEKQWTTMTAHTPGAAATCTEAQTCTVCQIELVKAYGHRTGTEATCTSGQICLICNAEVSAPLGHKAGEPATCTTAQMCKVCNAELMAALGHIPGAGATCTTPSECTVCGHILQSSGGHIPGAEATCTSAQTCSVCRAELVPALGHKPDKTTSCTSSQTCTVCNEVLAEAIGHKPGAPATCASAQVCTVCNEVLVAALAHTEEILPYVPATPTSSGLTQGKRCSVCSKILVKQNVIPATKPITAPSEYTITTDEKGINCSNLLDFNEGTNNLWAQFDDTTGKWVSKLAYGLYEYQPMNANGMPIAPVLHPYSSFSSHRWSLIEGGEALRFESTDSSIYPGISFALDMAQDKIFRIGRESGDPAKAEYVKVRVRNHSVCDQMTFGFVLQNTNNGRFVQATISDLTVDATGKKYQSSGEWETYVFSMHEINMNTNYSDLIYDPTQEGVTPSSRWGGYFYELLIFPFGYDVTDGIGNYPGAAMDIDYVVIGSLDYVTNYHSALEIKESNVKSLELIKAPVKTNYYVGEALDLAGLELKATYTDGTTEILYTASASVSTFDKPVNSVTLKLGNASVSYPVNVVDITGIEVFSTPSDPRFEVAELEYGFVSDGYRFKINYADGSFKLSDVDPSEANGAEIANSCIQFTCDDLTTPGTKTVTARYFGKTVDFDITAIQVVDVEITPIKEYRYGNKPNFERDFSVIFVYNDGTKIAGRDAALELIASNFECNVKNPGTVKAKVTLSNADYNLTFTKEIDVVVEAPVDVKIENLPYKTEYYVNEDFDPRGMQISLVYADGKKSLVDANDYYCTVKTSTPGAKSVWIRSDIVGLSEIFNAANLKITIAVIVLCNHQPGAAATCTSAQTCILCHSVLVPALAHQYVEKIVKPEALKSSPTENTPAIYYKSCACGAISQNSAETFRYGKTGGEIASEFATAASIPYLNDYLEAEKGYGNFDRPLLAIVKLMAKGIFGSIEYDIESLIRDYDVGLHNGHEIVQSMVFNEMKVLNDKWTTFLKELTGTANSLANELTTERAKALYIMSQMSDQEYLNLLENTNDALKNDPNARELWLLIGIDELENESLMEEYRALANGFSTKTLNILKNAGKVADVVGKGVNLVNTGTNYFFLYMFRDEVDAMIDSWIAATNDEGLIAELQAYKDSYKNLLNSIVSIYVDSGLASSDLKEFIPILAEKGLFGSSIKAVAIKLGTKELLKTISTVDLSVTLSNLISKTLLGLDANAFYTAATNILTIDPIYRDLIEDLVSYSNDDWYMYDSYIHKSRLVAALAKLEYAYCIDIFKTQLLTLDPYKKAAVQQVIDEYTAYSNTIDATMNDFIAYIYELRKG